MTTRLRTKTLYLIGSILFVVASLLKANLGRGYRSTDFEVHRNWLALTHSLPISQWYYEATSEWTLDYPPFFAYFEWVLSQFAQFVDPAMLRVENLGYDSIGTIIFQRGSVIVTDLVLLFGLLKFVTTLTHNKRDEDDRGHALKASTEESKAIAILMIGIFNAGLLLVDHIHFQYNGMLLGILLLSMAAINAERPIEGAFWFAILLQFKHIFLYIAPVYGVFLLRHACLDRAHWWDIRKLRWLNLIKLALIVVATFAISLGPFIVMGQLPQLLSRLFPFKRGLVHAYWAPNAWALYMCGDLVLARVFGLRSTSPNATSGLVGATSTMLLPEIPPIVTLILTVLSMLPVLYKVWQRATKPIFAISLVQISMCSFLFGWHVHEKAILMTIIPFTLICLERHRLSVLFLRLMLVGHYSLLPLIFGKDEALLRYVIVAFHWCASVVLIGKFYNQHTKGSHRPTSLLSDGDIVLVAGLVAISLFNEFVAPLWFPYLVFLPLMIVSVYCAVWIWVIYVELTMEIMRS